MKKSLFEKMGLVRSEGGDEESFDTNCVFAPAPVEILPEDVEVSQLENVMSIYEKGGLGDLSKSIFKVEEIKNALPKDLPRESKKVSVLGLVPLSGLDQTIVDVSTITNMADIFADASPVIEKPKFTEQQREKAKQQDNTQALLTQKLSVNFDTGAASIKEDSYAALNKFAETAKILNGVVIQIEGNTDDVGDNAANKTLSYNRAKAVATYLQFQGVDPTRFVVIGNGEDKPVADNNTPEGKAANRRTDAFFKVVN